MLLRMLKFYGLVLQFRRSWWWNHSKDALGNDVIEAAWLKTHGPGDRTLTQGLKVCVILPSALCFFTLEAVYLVS